MSRTPLRMTLESFEGLEGYPPDDLFEILHRYPGTGVPQVPFCALDELTEDSYQVRPLEHRPIEYFGAEYQLNWPRDPRLQVIIEEEDNIKDEKLSSEDVPPIHLPSILPGPSKEKLDAAHEENAPRPYLPLNSNPDLNSESKPSTSAAVGAHRKSDASSNPVIVSTTSISEEEFYSLTNSSGNLQRIAEVSTAQLKAAGHQASPAKCNQPTTAGSPPETASSVPKPTFNPSSVPGTIPVEGSGTFQPVTEVAKPKFKAAGQPSTYQASPVKPQPQIPVRSGPTKSADFSIFDPLPEDLEDAPKFLPKQNFTGRRVSSFDPKAAKRAKSIELEKSLAPRRSSTSYREWEEKVRQEEAAGCGSSALKEIIENPQPKSKSRLSRVRSLSNPSTGGSSPINSGAPSIAASSSKIDKPTSNCENEHEGKTHLASSSLSLFVSKKKSDTAHRKRYDTNPSSKTRNEKHDKKYATIELADTSTVFPSNSKLSSNPSIDESLSEKPVSKVLIESVKTSETSNNIPVDFESSSKPKTDERSTEMLGTKTVRTESTKRSKTTIDTPLTPSVSSPKPVVSHSEKPVKRTTHIESAKPAEKSNDKPLDSKSSLKPKTYDMPSEKFGKMTVQLESAKPSDKSIDSSSDSKSTSKLGRKHSEKPFKVQIESLKSSETSNDIPVDVKFFERSSAKLGKTTVGIDSAKRSEAPIDTPITPSDSVPPSEPKSDGSHSEKLVRKTAQIESVKPAEKPSDIPLDSKSSPKPETVDSPSEKLGKKAVTIESAKHSETSIDTPMPTSDSSPQPKTDGSHSEKPVKKTPQIESVKPAEKSNDNSLDSKPSLIPKTYDMPFEKFGKMTVEIESAKPSDTSVDSSSNPKSTSKLIMGEMHSEKPVEKEQIESVKCSDTSNDIPVDVISSKLKTDERCPEKLGKKTERTESAKHSEASIDTPMTPSDSRSFSKPKPDDISSEKPDEKIRIESVKFFEESIETSSKKFSKQKLSALTHSKMISIEIESAKSSAKHCIKLEKKAVHYPKKNLVVPLLEKPSGDPQSFESAIEKRRPPEKTKKRADTSNPTESKNSSDGPSAPKRRKSINANCDLQLGTSVNTDKPDEVQKQKSAVLAKCRVSCGAEPFSPPTISELLKLLDGDPPSLPPVSYYGHPDCSMGDECPSMHGSGAPAEELPAIVNEPKQKEEKETELENAGGTAASPCRSDKSKRLERKQKALSRLGICKVPVTIESKGTKIESIKTRSPVPKYLAGKPASSSILQATPHHEEPSEDPQQPQERASSKPNRLGGMDAGTEVSIGGTAWKPQILDRRSSSAEQTRGHLNSSLVSDKICPPKSRDPWKQQDKASSKPLTQDERSSSTDHIQGQIISPLPSRGPLKHQDEASSMQDVQKEIDIGKPASKVATALSWNPQTHDEISSTTEHTHGRLTSAKPSRDVQKPLLDASPVLDRREGMKVSEGKKSPNIDSIRRRLTSSEVQDTKSLKTNQIQEPIGSTEKPRMSGCSELQLLNEEYPSTTKSPRILGSTAGVLEASKKSFDQAGKSLNPVKFKESKEVVSPPLGALETPSLGLTKREAQPTQESKNSRVSPTTSKGSSGLMLPLSLKRQKKRLEISPTSSPSSSSSNSDKESGDLTNSLDDMLGPKKRSINTWNEQALLDKKTKDSREEVLRALKEEKKSRLLIVPSTISIGTIEAIQDKIHNVVEKLTVSKKPVEEEVKEVLIKKEPIGRKQSSDDEHSIASQETVTNLCYSEPSTPGQPLTPGSVDVESAADTQPNDPITDERKSNSQPTLDGAEGSAKSTDLPSQGSDEKKLEDGKHHTDQIDDVMDSSPQDEVIFVRSISPVIQVSSQSSNDVAYVPDCTATPLGRLQPHEPQVVDSVQDEGTSNRGGIVTHSRRVKKTKRSRMWTDRTLPSICALAKSRVSRGNPIVQLKRLIANELSLACPSSIGRKPLTNYKVLRRKAFFQKYIDAQSTGCSSISSDDNPTYAYCDVTKPSYDGNSKSSATNDRTGADLHEDKDVSPKPTESNTSNNETLFRISGTNVADSSFTDLTLDEEATPRPTGSSSTAGNPAGNVENIVEISDDESQSRTQEIIPFLSDGAPTTAGIPEPIPLLTDEEYPPRTERRQPPGPVRTRTLLPNPKFNPTASCNEPSQQFPSTSFRPNAAEKLPDGSSIRGRTSLAAAFGEQIQESIRNPSIHPRTTHHEVRAVNSLEGSQQFPSSPNLTQEVNVKEIGLDCQLITNETDCSPVTRKEEVEEPHRQDSVERNPSKSSGKKRNWEEASTDSRLRKKQREESLKKNEAEKKSVSSKWLMSTGRLKKERKSSKMLREKSLGMAVEKHREKYSESRRRQKTSERLVKEKLKGSSKTHLGRRNSREHSWEIFQEKEQRSPSPSSKKRNDGSIVEKVSREMAWNRWRSNEATTSKKHKREVSDMNKDITRRQSQDDQKQSSDERNSRKGSWEITSETSQSALSSSLQISKQGNWNVEPLEITSLDQSLKTSVVSPEKQGCPPEGTPESMEIPTIQTLRMSPPPFSKETHLRELKLLSPVNMNSNHQSSLEFSLLQTPQQHHCDIPGSSNVQTHPKMVPPSAHQETYHEKYQSALLQTPTTQNPSMSNVPITEPVPPLLLSTQDVTVATHKIPLVSIPRKMRKVSMVKPLQVSPLPELELPIAKLQQEVLPMKEKMSINSTNDRTDLSMKTRNPEKQILDAQQEAALTQNLAPQDSEMKKPDTSNKISLGTLATATTPTGLEREYVNLPEKIETKHRTPPAPSQAPELSVINMPGKVLLKAGREESAWQNKLKSGRRFLGRRLKSFSQDPVENHPLSGNLKPGVSPPNQESGSQSSMLLNVTTEKTSLKSNPPKLPPNKTYPTPNPPKHASSKNSPDMRISGSSKASPTLTKSSSASSKSNPNSSNPTKASPNPNQKRLVENKPNQAPNKYLMTHKQDSSLKKTTPKLTNKLSPALNKQSPAPNRPNQIPSRREASSRKSSVALGKPNLKRKHWDSPANKNNSKRPTASSSFRTESGRLTTHPITTTPCRHAMDHTTSRRNMYTSVIPVVESSARRGDLISRASPSLTKMAAKSTPGHTPRAQRELRSGAQRTRSGLIRLT